MVDHVRHMLVGCPLLRRKARRGVGIADAQGGPPVAFQLFFEGPGIERAEDVATHALGVLGHEGQGWLEQPIGGCENVAEQPGVVEQRGRVLAVVTCQEADLVQGVEVAGAIGADVGSCAIHELPAAARLPRG